MTKDMGPVCAVRERFDVSERPNSLTHYGRVKSQRKLSSQDFLCLLAIVSICSGSEKSSLHSFQIDP
jgi:hypothetical protein